jgi:hypothetical protein
VSNSLATLSQIHRALAAITSVPEAKDLRDKAAALCRYAKESKQSLEIQNRAAYVKLLCERKAGALLLSLPRKQGNRNGEDGLRAMLAQSGIAESTARRWQYLAQWPEALLVDLLEACNEDEDELTTSIAVSSARSFLESVKAAKEREEAEPEDEPADEADEELPEWASDEPEELEVVEREEEPAPPEEEKPSPLRVEAERADRLIQLFDAACDLCRDSPPLVGWITTMHKWQTKLNDLTREI